MILFITIRTSLFIVAHLDIAILFVLGYFSAVVVTVFCYFCCCYVAHLNNSGKCCVVGICCWLGLSFCCVCVQISVLPRALGAHCNPVWSRWCNFCTRACKLLFFFEFEIIMASRYTTKLKLNEKEICVWY